MLLMQLAFMYKMMAVVVLVVLFFFFARERSVGEEDKGEQMNRI
jgi:hypothetical protein